MRRRYFGPSSWKGGEGVIAIFVTLALALIVFWLMSTSGKLLDRGNQVGAAEAAYVFGLIATAAFVISSVGWIITSFWK